MNLFDETENKYFGSYHIYSKTIGSIVGGK